MKRKMRFHERWISLMMMCVTSISYSILINGEPKGRIVPSRGLRQGDPISPYLFLLCAEGLSAMFKKEERKGHLRGIAVCRGAPRISHLLFVDDSIVFCKATREECDRILKVLEDYEGDLGQKINRDQTSLYFSQNTREVKNYVKEKLGVRVIQHHEQYLELPLLVGKGKERHLTTSKTKLGGK